VKIAVSVAASTAQEEKRDGAELQPSSKHSLHSSPGTCFTSSSHIVGAALPVESVMDEVSREHFLINVTLSPTKTDFKILSAKLFNVYYCDFKHYSLK